MKISFSILNNKAVIPEMENGLLVFHSAGPAVLQPGEIKRIKTGLAIAVEEGCVLQIISWAGLHEKGICVFPGPLVIDSSHSAELFIPLQNNGRGQVNLLPGDIVARGVGVKTEQIEITELTAPPSPPKASKTRPSKKNADIKFEIK